MEYNYVEDINKVNLKGKRAIYEVAFNDSDCACYFTNKAKAIKYAKHIYEVEEQQLKFKHVWNYTDLSIEVNQIDISTIEYDEDVEGIKEITNFEYYDCVYSKSHSK